MRGLRQGLQLLGRKQTFYGRKGALGKVARLSDGPYLQIARRPGAGQLDLAGCAVLVRHGNDAQIREIGNEQAGKSAQGGLIVE